MCDLVRHEAAAERPAALPASEPGRGKTRWAGAVAAAVIGGLAFAALVAPSPISPQAVPAVASMQAVQALGAGPRLEPAALSADDGVPSSPDVARAGLAPCHHGL